MLSIAEDVQLPEGLHVPWATGLALWTRRHRPLRIAGADQVGDVEELLTTDGSVVSRGARDEIIKLLSLLVFDGCHCYFLVVVFGGISILQRPIALKVKIPQRIVSELYESLRSTMRKLTYPAAGSTMVWCSPFALVLATDLLPKRQRPYRVLNVR